MKRIRRTDIIRFLSKHKAEFEEEFTVKRIGIFGSFARGNPRGAKSDIDVVVELGEPDLFYMIGIKQAVEEAFGRKVDVVRLRKGMNGFLRASIERDALYV